MCKENHGIPELFRLEKSNHSPTTKLHSQVLNPSRNWDSWAAVPGFSNLFHEEFFSLKSLEKRRLCPVPPSDSQHSRHCPQFSLPRIYPRKSLSSPSQHFRYPRIPRELPAAVFD